MNNKLTLHTARIESLADIARLQAKCFGEDSLWCPCLWERAILAAHTVVTVDEDNEIAGFGVCEEGRVIGVGVWSPYRRTGTARAILELLEGSVTTVADDNLAAQLWLKSCGWKCSRIVGNRYEFVPMTEAEKKDQAKKPKPSTIKKATPRKKPATKAKPKR